MTCHTSKALYNDWAETYEESLESWLYRAPSRVASVLLEHGMVDSAASRIVDLGCGTGLCGEALRTAGLVGCDIDGVDISASSLELAMAKPYVYTDTYEGSLDVRPCNPTIHSVSRESRGYCCDR